ncbi:OLC1v1021045C1 [Oldenlandia corymbosa var. corymbosa]|uniref:OLC1v1021045C1 n=1 Tax=Oldenlandia corymbosa var. corymbosa TaxID=529605 RepID=A0AAV1BUT9_OLDCO|nr:OLC1v1021045C1 [Oldenlandia corymbosa var. corymbosa]
MDFHSLTRRQLQTLCKRNRIPANLTNVAMADALSALPVVEGMDEISPAAKSVAAAGGGGASTCRRTTATATRRRTRQTPAKLMETLDFSGSGEEVGRGFLNGEQYLNNLTHHATPAPPPDAAALTLGGAAQGTRRSTRLAIKNSALVGKNNANADDDSNRLQTVVKKMDFGEARKGQEDSSAYDWDLVAESLRGIDLNEKPKDGLLEKSNVDGDRAAWSAKYDSSVTPNQNQNRESEIEGAGAADICSDDVSKEDDRDEVTKTHNTFEVVEELDSANNHVVAATEDDRINNEGDNASREKIEAGEEELDANNDDTTAPEDNIDHMTDGNANVNVAREEEVMESKLDPYQTETNNDVEECSLDGEKDVNYENLYPLGMDALLDAGFSAVTESSEVVEATSEKQQDVVVVGSGVAAVELPAIMESMVADGGTLEEAKLAEKFNDMELNDFGLNSSSVTTESAGANAVVALEQRLVADYTVVEMENKVDEQEEKALTNIYLECSTEPNQKEHTAAVTADSNDNLCINANFNSLRSPVSNISSVSSPNPGKKNTPLLQKSAGRKTPSTSAKRMIITKVLDENKENNIIGNCGTNLMMTSPAKEKNEKKGSLFPMDPWKDASLGKLKKELKTRLEKANNKGNDKACTRPALQALTEN